MLQACRSLACLSVLGWLVRLLLGVISLFTWKWRLEATLDVVDKVADGMVGLHRIVNELVDRSTNGGE